MESTITKGVYKLIKQNNEYGLIYDRPYLEVPSKIYGKSAKYAAHFFNTFKFSKESCGGIFIGPKGSGKTELSNMIGNIAINNNMFVVEVTNIEPDINIVNFIDDLSDCVIIFDEFGKVFDRVLQDKMLTMFSNSTGKKFFAITDNDKYRISDLIIDRPGRIRYHLDMNRVEEDVVKEYCTDKGTSEKFYNELMRIYRSSTIFTFDHLKALVSEHLLDKTVSIDDIIKILNVKILGKKLILKVGSIVSKDDDNTKIFETYNTKTLEKSEFDSGRRFYINYKIILKSDVDNKDNSNNSNPFNSNNNTLYISNENVIDIDEYNKFIICEKNNLKIKLDIEEV